MTTEVGEQTGTLGRLWPGAFWLALAVGAGALVFHPGIAGLLTAWARPEYSHGPLIPVISGYLFLRQLKLVPAQAGRTGTRWPGALVVLAAVLMAVVGRLSGFDEIVAYALILWIGGLILTSMGWERGRHFWPPVLHLVFMLPLPDVFYYKASLTLQLISSVIGVEIVRAFGIPVFLEGNIIDLGVYKLQVAEACSGLRYIFPIMSFTYIFAVLYQGPVWIKAVLLLAAVPLAILMNSIRIGFIGIMVDNYGIGAAEGFMHLFEGWVIFLLCIAAMIGLARLMQRLTGDRRPFAEALDLDVSGLAPQLARVGDIRPSAALLGTSAAIAAVGGLMLAAPAIGLARTPEPVERTPFAFFPETLGGWQAGPRKTLSERVEQVLAADDYIITDYRHPDQPTGVNFYVAWYLDQRDGGTHSPEICIPGGGWEIDALERTQVAIETAEGPRQVRLNRIVIRNGMRRQLAYYWYDQRGRHLASDIAAKGWLLWDAASTGRSDGALVRLVTTMLPGEEIPDAERRIRAFMRLAMPELPRFIETEWPAGPGR